MTDPRQILENFEAYLIQQQHTTEPAGLYSPVNYIMSLGGKRIRPVMLLLANQLYGGNLQQALPAAYAVELFHNFTLVHDDIMDEAPLRRGKPTVHTKYGNNTAILSGDVMMIYVYQYLNQLNAELLTQILSLFNRAAIEVCEGQQYDMEFENRQQVSLDEYLTMISGKTAVLLAASLQLGGLIAGAPKEEQEKLFQLGMNMGLSFQIQDDYLDTFGDPEKFGKTVGGDIQQNKKTYLLIRALELAGGDEKTELLNWLQTTNNNSSKVQAVSQLYKKLGVDGDALVKQQEYYNKSMQLINEMAMAPEGKLTLLKFIEDIFGRDK